MQGWGVRRFVAQWQTSSWQISWAQLTMYEKVTVGNIDG